MQSIASVAELRALDPSARKSARAWALSHFSDPVHRADLATIWRRPAWLPKDGPNPVGVDPDERWKPVLTFLKSVRMAIASANKEVPGEFGAHGHDYRAELPELLREAFDFDSISDPELARITDHVRTREKWIMNQQWR